MEKTQAGEARDSLKSGNVLDKTSYKKTHTRLNQYYREEFGELKLKGPKMNFNRIVYNRIEKIKETLADKEQEYAVGGNRFHNFDVAARIDNETPEKSLWGMYKKHLVSVMDLVEHPDGATEYLINEKLGDAINYMILLEGLLLRRISEGGDK